MCGLSFFIAKISDMAEFKVRYEPPRGYPLGVNPTFRICANLIIPLFNLFMKKAGSLNAAHENTLKVVSDSSSEYVKTEPSAIIIYSVFILTDT
jgi:hypothetical protein